MKRNWRKKNTRYIDNIKSILFGDLKWIKIPNQLFFSVIFVFFCSFIYVKHEQRYKCVTVSLATGLQNNFVNHGNFMSLNEICIRRQFFQMTFQVTASAIIKRRVFVYYMRMQPPGKLYHRESGGNSERSRWRAHENASKFPFVCHK